MSKAVIRKQTVSFRRMDEEIEKDYAFLHKLKQSLISAVSQRIVSALKTLEYSLSGSQVSRFACSLKTATRADHDGADIELIMAALIHDGGDDLAPENYSRMAAENIPPHFSTEITWTLKMHSGFQMCKYAYKTGQNLDKQERWREHWWFASYERFCPGRDQVSFDWGFVSKLLSHFISILNEIFSQPAFVPCIVPRDASGQQPYRL